MTEPDIAPVRRRVEAARAAAAVLDVLDVRDVAELLRVARWLLGEPAHAAPDDWPRRAATLDDDRATWKRRALAAERERDQLEDQLSAARSELHAARDCCDPNTGECTAEQPQPAEHQDHAEPTANTGAPARLGDLVPELARSLGAHQARTARR